MDNSDLYRFSDFTLENYQRLIRIAKNQEYHFAFFTDQFREKKKYILWRHDVEFSPFVALEMAEIEFEENVKSTFFFQLHSEFYNVLEKEVTDIVYRIVEMGHEIGLHFDAHYFNITQEVDISQSLKIDAEYFSTIFKKKLKVFSFHNTNSFILSCQKNKYAGLINVYSNSFKNKFRYCTDSTGYWRYERLEDVLLDPTISKLQVLTHDAMWSELIRAPRQRVFDAIEKNSQRIKRIYDFTLNKFNARNIDN